MPSSSSLRINSSVAAAVSLLLLLSISGRHAYASRPVSHVHLGLVSDATVLNVQWTSATGDTLGDGSSVVEWGSSPKPPFQFTSVGSNWWYVDATSPTSRNYTFNIGQMTGLTPGETYFYRVGNPLDGWSSISSFVAQRSGTTQFSEQQPLKIGWFGDLGWINGQALPYLQSESDVDFFIHIGDYAYDLISGDGLVGDDFESSVESLTSSYPYQGCPGNHEWGDSFNHYNHRFRVFVGNTSVTSGVTPSNIPQITPGLPNNHWYSWESAAGTGSGVHIISMSTEVYFMTPAAAADQFAWLEADLASVDRKSTPWLIVYGHRSIYCSCDSDCDTDATDVREGINNGTGLVYGMEALLNRYNVNIWLNAHEHNYERNYPTLNKTLATPPSAGKPGGNASDPEVIVNAQAPVYIISGCAGDSEHHEPFTRPQPPYSAFRSNTYGYARMTIYNATTLLWEAVETDNEYPETTGTVIDAMLLIQNA